MGAAAQRLDLVGRLQFRHDADDLARADIEDREDGALARGKRLQARRQTVTRETHVSTPLPRIGFFFSASARARAASSVKRTTTRSAMRRSIASTSFSRIFCSCSSFTSRASASAAAELRQAHVHAVVHLERPAPPGDERACADAALERARGFEQREIILVAGVGALAHHEGQVEIALVLHQVDDRAVGRDDEQFAVVLPERMRLALGERDDEFVRIELAHRAPT